MTQSLHLSEEALSLAGLCQELIHVPTGIELGVMETMSDSEITGMSVVARVREGKQPSQFPRQSDCLFKTGVIINQGPYSRQGPPMHAVLCVLTCGILNHWKIV